MTKRMQAPTDWRNQAVLTADEAAPVIKCSRNRVYEMMNSGLLPCVQLGRKKLIPVSALIKRLNGE